MRSRLVGGVLCLPGWAGPAPPCAVAGGGARARRAGGRCRIVLSDCSPPPVYHTQPAATHLWGQSPTSIVARG